MFVDVCARVSRLADSRHRAVQCSYVRGGFVVTRIMLESLYQCFYFKYFLTKKPSLWKRPFSPSKRPIRTFVCLDIVLFQVCSDKPVANHDEAPSHFSCAPKIKNQKQIKQQNNKTNPRSAGAHHAWGRHALCNPSLAEHAQPALAKNVYKSRSSPSILLFSLII